MSQTFKLQAAGAYGSVTPGCGENLGAALARFADEEEKRFRANPEAKVMYWANDVVQLQYLAAEAFEAGASASIGHNRSDRYLARAKELRDAAEALEAQAKRERDAAEAASMKVAFMAGFAGEDASRYSFEARDAHRVGAHFAERNTPFPKLVRVVRHERGRRNIEVDGVEYVVRQGPDRAWTVEPVQP